MRQRSCLLVLLLAGCGGGGAGSGGGVAATATVQPMLAATYRPTGKAAQGAVLVQLFEWRWADVARECEVWLGPKGYTGVQISPPSEHAMISSTSSGANYPWWQRYQTVSYRLDKSRSGTLAEFTDMVGRCRSAGVDIYADAVINHMTAQSVGVGSAGSPYSKYSYPAVPFGAQDFHSPCAVNDYSNGFNVQECELLGLADLYTERESVRSAIAGYLIGLQQSGVAGFRVDAAKHINAVDLDAILGKVNAAAQSGGRSLPYVFLEVIDHPGEAVRASDYLGVGYASGGAADTTEFSFGAQVSDAFLGRNGASLSSLNGFTDRMMPADKALVFNDNHDTQRASAIFYQDAAYELAQIFTLAQPYGVVSVMSSYGFDRSSAQGYDTGPPGSGGVTQSSFTDLAAGISGCSAQIGSVQPGRWICEHRRPAIAAMVAFRKVNAGLPLSNWQTLGSSNQVAFARKAGAASNGLGFVALNGETILLQTTVQTTLVAGSYCNVVKDVFTTATGVQPAACSGTTVTVASDGTAVISVPALSAVALHADARVQ